MTKLFYAAAALALLSSAPAQALQECMPGVSCHQMAEAVVSFGIVRDCPAIFAIKPELKSRYDDIIQALKSAPAQKGAQRLSSKRQPVAPGLCDKVAGKVLKGTTNIEFLAVKPDAAARLMPSAK
jgi:hypothetical protein